MGNGPACVDNEALHVPGCCVFSRVQLALPDPGVEPSEGKPPCPKVACSHSNCSLVKGGCIDIPYSQLQQLLTEPKLSIYLMLVKFSTDIRMCTPTYVCLHVVRAHAPPQYPHAYVPPHVFAYTWFGYVVNPCH